MRALVLDKTILTDIRRLKEFADRERYSTKELEGIIAGRIPPPGDYPRFAIHIPHGFRAVYSIEQQPPPLDWCHHLSVSVDTPGKYPNEHAVVAIANAFGLPIAKLQDAIVTLEKNVQAVNVILPLAGALPSDR